jgi:hypothetical protein
MERSVSRIVPADALGGERVVDREGREIGTIDDLVIDVPRGRIAYAVMTESGRAKRIAVPWNALTRDEARSCFVLDLDARGLSPRRRRASPAA